MSEKSGNLPIILYDSPPSPCARRVRITLLEKKIPYETRLIDLAAGEQKAPAFLEINPNGKVPAIVHGDRVLYESNVITEYLDEAFDAQPLYPSDPADYFAVRSWQAFERDFAQVYFQLMYMSLFGPLARTTKTKEQYDRETYNSSDDPAFHAYREATWNGTVLTPAEIADYQARLRGVLDTLENALEGRDWLVGDSFSQAEISIYPRLVMFPWLGIEFSDKTHPNVTRWTAKLTARPSFVKSETGLSKIMQKPLVRQQMRWLKTWFDTPETDRTAFMKLRFAIMKRVLTAKMADNSADKKALQTVEAELLGAVVPAVETVPGMDPRSAGLTVTGPAGSQARLALEAAARHAGIAFSSHAQDTLGATMAGLSVEGMTDALLLIDRLSGGALLPQTPFERAQARLWLDRDLEGETKYLAPLGRADASNSERAAALRWLGKRWRRLGGALQRDFVFDQPSAADFALWCQLEEDLGRGLTEADLPEAVLAWRQRMAGLTVQSTPASVAS